jgi:hypothetical protein
VPEQPPKLKKKRDKLEALREATETRDKLEALREAIKTRINQISAAPGLNQERDRAEVQKLLAEGAAIEYVLSLNGPRGSRRWSGAR